MQVPSDAATAGWFTGAPTPGSLGPAVIIGHVHWQRRDGVFAQLSQLTRGDHIQIDRADGNTAVFQVTRTIQVKKSAFPTGQVYGNIATAGLRLTTCGGLDPSTHTYNDNIVVFAELGTARSR